MDQIFPEYDLDTLKSMSTQCIQHNIDVHSAALKKLKMMLPGACKREGHYWTEPKRRHKEMFMPVYEMGQTDMDGSEMYPGTYRDVPTDPEYYWERRCTVCGLVEGRQEIVQVTRKNPFDESKS